MNQTTRTRYRHPIAKRYPVKPPPRIEMDIHREFWEKTRYDNPDGAVCSCFPQPSSIAIPSMFYDGLKCPHQHQEHIQPAQDTIFRYPWTAQTNEYDRDSLRNGGLSRISENRNRTASDINTILTAPPFIHHPRNDARDYPPFTAPMEDIDGYDYRYRHRRAQSLNDVRDGESRGRSPNRSRLSDRTFIGSYRDPRDGKVYSYNVNYGKQSVEATRRPRDVPIGVRKPTPKM